jgi:hypothetical protein
METLTRLLHRILLYADLEGSTVISQAFQSQYTREIIANSDTECFSVHGEE